MKIRKFIPQDLKRVYEIENMSFDELYGINMFKQLYDMGVGFLVAEKDNYVIGYVMFWMKYENQGHIISIAVDKNYRRMKVGFKLLSRAVSILAMLPLEKIILEVREDNNEAVEFYKKFGFEIERRVPNYYNNKIGAIVMCFDLDSS